MGPVTNTESNLSAKPTPRSFADLPDGSQTNAPNRAETALKEGAEGALVLQGERSHPGGCENPADWLRWLTHDGRLLPVRCGAPNRCRYCSWLTALENAYVVTLDAHDVLPQLGFTLTTKAAMTAPATFRKDVEQVVRAVRRRWPWAEYLAQIEFTTGTAQRSGGARRIHLHGLLKGVPREDAAELEALLRRVWLARTGAHRVEAHELHRPAGAMAYLINHHAKEAQKPPRGWSGKRLRPSQGYFESPIADLRNEARWALAEKRTRVAVEAALESQGAWEVLTDDERWDAVEDGVKYRRTLPPPTLVRVTREPTEWTEDGLPGAFREVTHAVHG